MTVNPSIDPARMLEEQLDQASPDLLRQMLQVFINTLLRCRGRRGLRCRLRPELAGAGELPQRLPAPRLRHPRRHPRRRDPEAAPGLLLPRVAPRAPHPSRESPDLRGRDLLPPGCVDEADEQARAVPWCDRVVEVAGLRDGPRARCARRGVPHPTVGRLGTLHVRRRRRPGPQGPRRWPGRARARPGRHWHQR